MERGRVCGGERKREDRDRERRGDLCRLRARIQKQSFTLKAKAPDYSSLLMRFSLALFLVRSLPRSLPRSLSSWLHSFFARSAFPSSFVSCPLLRLTLHTGLLICTGSVCLCSRQISRLHITLCVQLSCSQLSCSVWDAEHSLCKPLRRDPLPQRITTDQKRSS